MQVDRAVRDGYLVLTPRRALTVGGAAEELEDLLQAVLAEGHRHLIVSLAQVSHIDSGGVRALVRGYVAAQRLSGTLALAAVAPRVHHVLAVMRLDRVFSIFASVDAAIASHAGA